MVRESPVASATAAVPPQPESLCLGGGPAAEDALVHEGGEGLILRSQHRYSFLGVHVRNLRAIAMPNWSTNFASAPKL